MKPSAWISLLEDWFRRTARLLPWRAAYEPYAIWISEVMLQQTQVTTVLPYFDRFMKKFPTIKALAEAREEEVLTAWSGLGYYSRARNLHKGAKFLMERYEGKFPRTREAMLEVPGVGPYTAGAVLSIAFEVRAPLVDGNVQRVFARFFGVEDPLSSTAANRKFWSYATESVEACDSPRLFNQALMELGAVICIKGTPRCGQCPVSQHCHAFKEGRQSQLPVKKPQREKKQLRWVSLVMESKGKFFLRKTPAGEWWADLWDFPHYGAEERELSDWIKSLSAVSHQGLGIQKHTVTHHRLEVKPYLFRLNHRRLPKGLADRGEWFSYDEAQNLPLSSLARKVISSIPVLK